MTPRGGSARERRTQRRSDERRRQQEGVNEALVLTAASGETFAIPDSADYRPASEGSDESCASCSHFSNGECSLWSAAVDSTYTCDSWEGKSAASLDEENFAAIRAFAADGACMNCGHAAMSHEDGMGACSIEGCSCEKMAAAEEEAALTAAAGDVAWSAEEGMMDLLDDVCHQLNPPDSWRWWASDVALDLSKVLVCDGEAGEWWVVPITLTDSEPVLAARDEWVSVDSAWVESDEDYASKLAAFIEECQKRGVTLNANFATMATGSSTVSNTMHLMLRDLTFAPLDIPAVAPGAEANVTPPPATSGALRWTATLCPEGAATDDGRIFAPGSIEWRDLPLTLMGMVETQEGHDGAQVCGRIDEIWREEATGLIRGSGEFDTGDFGSEIARMVDDKTLRGISVDIAVSEMEIAYRSSVLDEEGRWAENSEAEDLDMLDVLFGDQEEPVLFVVRKGVIGAATVCPFQAFREATIEMASSLVAASQSQMIWTATSQAGFVVTQAALTASAGPEGEVEPDAQADALVAAGALTAAAAGMVPEAPPHEWFDDPKLEELTGLTVTDDGRIFGHAAAWDTCHIGIPGVCTTAPESHSDYAYFHLKEVVCDDGARISCGTITLDAPHADQPASRANATAHYDNTGTATADVVVGEDEFGIWVAGALRPDVDAAAARKLRGATLSGDWRDVNGNLELIALLAVNVPGFPVPRTRALVASADDGPQVVTLIAAGVHRDGVVATIRAGIDNIDAERFKALGDMDAYAEIAADAA